MSSIILFFKRIWLFIKKVCLVFYRFFFPEENRREFYTEKSVGYSLAIIALLVTVFSSYLPDEFTIDTFVLSVIVLGFLLIDVFNRDKIYRDYNRLITNLDSETKGVINSYKQLKKHELWESYNDFFIDFTRYNLPVLAIQSYNYYQMPSLVNGKIKIEYEHGYVQENVNINTLYQSYHVYNLLEVEKLREGIEAVKNTNKGDKLLDFIVYMTENENKNKDSNLSDDQLALISIASELLNEAAAYENLVFDSLLNSFSFKSIIYDKPIKKRVGLFKSIVYSHILDSDKTYKFEYNRENNDKDNEKDNRLYVAIKANSSKGKRRIFLIVLDKTVMSDDPESESDAIVSNFEDLLSRNSLKEG